ncbi:MAG: BLUF domain-containing protein [Pseudomonadota bacterium]
MLSLAYFSSAVGPLTPDALGQLLTAAQDNNRRLEVTGLLCHYDGSFLQFLEGPDEAVLSLYERIARDARHRDLLVVRRAPITRRAFPDWTMALVSPREVTDAQRAFARGLRDLEIDADAEDRAALRGLLDAFRAWLR